MPLDIVMGEKKYLMYLTELPVVNKPAFCQPIAGFNSENLQMSAYFFIFLFLYSNLKDSNFPVGDLGRRSGRQSRSEIRRPANR